MNTADSVVVDLTIEDDGKIKMRYRGEAVYIWIPSVVWVVN